MTRPETPPPITPKKPKRERPKSRPQRWADACSAAMSALDTIEGALDEFESACSDLQSVQEEYAEWQGNLPENLANSALGEKLQAVADMSIEDAASGVRSAVEEARGLLDEAESANLPRGFGNDRD